MDELKVNITANGDEVVVRTGEAAPARERRDLVLSGDINAPADFYAKRTSEINKLNSHIVIDKENFSIELFVDETNHFKTSIKGRLIPFTELQKLKINENKTYSPRELYDAIKFQGTYFKNRDQHKALCEKLTKFTSRIETDFVNSNDFKGNVALQKLTKIKTDLDLNFILAIPVFKGSEPSTFQVEICLDSKDGGVICWLESVELHEIRNTEGAKMIQSTIDSLSEFVQVNI